MLSQETNTGLSVRHAFPYLIPLQISEAGAVIRPHFTDVEPKRLIYSKLLRWEVAELKELTWVPE